MISAVIFDFDYTLGDSTDGIVACANYALEQLGLPPQSVDAVRRTVGLSLTATYTALTGDPDAEKANLFADGFRRKADEVMAASASLYDGALPFLRGLRAKGIRTAIVTTKFGYRIREILTRFDALDLVDVIVGAEDVTAVKPDPEGLQTALRQLKCAAPDALYVGDSVVDAAAAAAAGIPFVAVLTGTTEREAFEAYPHRHIAPDLWDIARHLCTPR